MTPLNIAHLIPKAQVFALLVWSCIYINKYSIYALIYIHKVQLPGYYIEPVTDIWMCSKDGISLVHTDFIANAYSAYSNASIITRTISVCGLNDNHSADDSEFGEGPVSPTLLGHVINSGPCR